MNPGVIILLVVIGIGAILYATGNLDFMFKDDDKKPKTTTTTTTPTSLKPPDPDPDPDAPSKGHKVRITHVDAFDPDAPSDELQLVNLSQVEVYDSSDKNVSSGKTVTGLPGTWDGHSFASLVDGDTSTVAHTKGTGVHSMTIDLGKETEIDSIVITNRVDCCRPRAIGIRVEILDDDDKVVKTTRQIAKNAKKYTYDFTATNPVWEYTDEEPFTPQSPTISTCVGTCPATLPAINSSCRVRTQGDGNLVIYDSASAVKWATGTYGRGTAPYRSVMQTDGNYVLYDSSNTPLWATGTNGRGTPPYRVVMQNDCNLVVYDSKDEKLWESGTSS
jgi:hypothetical protein